MKTYLVGGAVRDKLLGFTPHEHDWVVVGATVEEMQALGYEQVGKDFPVFLHPQTKDEYALARTERKSGRGYTGFSVSFDPSVTLEQDLLRRDLTINAIAETAEGELIDPVAGQQDIQQRLLRHVSDAFVEDPLRVLRIARFLARFSHLGFTIAAETRQLLENMAATGELTDLTPERVWKEWQKSLDTQSPHKFLELLQQLNATPQVLDGLLVNTQVLDCIRRVAEQTETTELRFAAVFVMQPPTFELAEFCRQLAIPNRFYDVAQLALQQQQLILQQAKLSHPQLFELLQAIDYWRRPQRLTQFLCLRRVLGHTQQDSNAIENAAAAAKQVNAKQLIADGLKGPEVGQALAQRRQAIFFEHLPDD